MNIEIANRLVNLRKANNLSQEALAEKLGISIQAVSKWERAEASPDTDNLILLARLYGVSLDELLKTEDEIPRPEISMDKDTDYRDSSREEEVGNGYTEREAWIFQMNKIDAKGLILRIFTPTIVLSLSYLLLGHFCSIPHILLFCILGTVTLVPMELGVIVSASKRENGVYSLKSAFVGQEKLPLWKILIIAFVFFGVAGLLSVFVAPIENLLFSEIRATVLNDLPIGFDWTNYEYVKSFSKPILFLTCVYYGVFNVLIGPITEELFFRGYLIRTIKSKARFYRYL